MMVLDPGSAGWSFRSEAEVIDPLDAEQPQQVINDAVAAAQMGISDQIETMLATIPDGARLCVHDGPKVSSSFDFASDLTRITVRQRGHTLLPGQECDYVGTCTEYSPKPTITARKMVAYAPVQDGECPECGKPGARWVAVGTAGFTVLEHATDAEHDACPNVIHQRGIAELTNPALWEGLYAEAFDNALWQGIVTDPPGPSDLPDKLREMFKRVSEHPGYNAETPAVSPATAERHRAAADLPRPPWIAVKRHIGDPDAAAHWMQLDSPGAFAPGVDPWGSLRGRQLFRTGTFLARPDGAGGWDVAEVMVTS